MKHKPRAIIFFSILFTYVVLQFLWWEILLVKQSGQIIDEKQKIVALSVSDDKQLKTELRELQNKRATKTVMIVSEGTVFLLLLLFGVYKIKQAYDKEDELRRQQNNFFLSITHELKTPIAATKLQLQTIQKQKPEANVQEELIKNALQETERLNTLIDNVLLASRMESPGFKVELSPIDLSELIQKLVKRYYSKESGSGSLHVNTNTSKAVMADEQALTSILTNLVDNALNYSGDEKNIHIQLSQHGEKIVLEVKDSGVGVSKQDKEKIFNRFYRAGNEETRRSKGTGLGLYIVKKLVEAQKGDIQVRDNDPSGTIFSIRFNAA
jgi:two-component system, OmpR family, sensor histidine kinase CiaH